MTMQRVFPFLGWRKEINKTTLRTDFFAGLTVALVLVPQSMAYALLAGVPVYYGLYAAFLPAVVGAMFGSSRQLATGPVAMTSLLTAASIQGLGIQGEEAFVAYAVLLALISGLIQLGLGLVRGGFIVNFVSHPALIGFTSAAALIIAGSQLSAILNVPMPKTGVYLRDVMLMLGNIAQTHWLTLITGLLSLVALIGFKKYAPKFPGALVVVGIAIVVSYLFEFHAQGVKVVGEIPSGLPDLSVPMLDLHASISLIPAALVIALISFMEAMASARIMATKDRVQWDSNQELIGQGLAKIAAAFSHGFPVSGSFSRSALNHASGAKTGMSSIFTALVLMLTLLFLTPLLYHLPLAVLAALIMTAVGGLFNYRGMRESWKATTADGLVAWITFIASLAFAPNIQNGILTGVLLALGCFIYRTMRPRIALLGRHEDGTLRDAARFELPMLHTRIAAMRFDNSLYFANVSYFEDAVLRLTEKDPDLRFIVVVADGINMIDASGAHTLDTLSRRMKENGITLVFTGMKQQVLQVLESTGVMNRIGRENFYRTSDIALQDIYNRLEDLPDDPAFCRVNRCMISMRPAQ